MALPDQNAYNRFLAQIAAWFDLRGGFTCSMCGQAEWSFLGYKMFTPDQILGPHGDANQMGSYMMGRVECLHCRATVEYNLTSMGGGELLELD